MSFIQDFTYTQKLISPITESGQKKSLADLMAELSTPVLKAGEFKFLLAINYPEDT